MTRESKFKIDQSHLPHLDFHDEFVVKLHDGLLKLAEFPAHLVSLLGKTFPDVQEFPTNQIMT